MKYFKLNLLIAFFFLSFAALSQEQPSLNEVAKANDEIQVLLAEAEVSIDQLNFDSAMEQLNHSLELSKSIGHKRYIALTSSIIAKLYYIKHDYDRAITELQRAISIQREIEDEVGLAYSYVNFGKTFLAKKDAQRALSYLNQAERIYKEREDEEHLGIVSLNRGSVYLNLIGDHEKALAEFNKAEKLLEDSENYYEKARLNYFRGRTHLKLENIKLAEEDAQAGLELSRKKAFSGMEMSNNRLLSDIYEAKGDFSKALAYARISDEIRESIFNLNREALAVDANTRYGVDALRSSMNELTRRNAEQQRSLKVNKLTTILSVALITILSLLTLSLYKNNNLRARANELLQKKNNELTKAKENAEKASLAKAQFLSTITHELRTPLYAVTGLTHLLLEESPTENQKEHLNSLKFSGEYLLSLINNILDLNKLEANKVEIVETSFNLEKRISDVLVALKNSADEKNTKIHFDFGADIPQKLKGDPLKISQVLINLIGNSIKFTEDGDIWISVKKARQESAFVWLDFEIRDNGEGISREKQKAIFENFTQGSTQINRKFGGTGLGLSIVKNLLNLMGSEVKLESDLGKGSKFSFQLKFEAFEMPKETSKESIALEDSNIMKGKKILIVEDNKINQMITRKILEKNGVICEVSDTGDLAIGKVKNGDFDLILMDIHMPGISGIEATVQIRKFNEEIPIIALTAVTLEESLEDFYKNGFNDIIPKPYKTEEFFNKINKHLSLTKSTV
jgi:signal transduction histidine kinase/CheY-like chemotaxis protein